MNWRALSLLLLITTMAAGCGVVSPSVQKFPSQNDLLTQYFGDEATGEPRLLQSGINEDSEFDSVVSSLNVLNQELSSQNVDQLKAETGIFISIANGSPTSVELFFNETIENMANSAGFSAEFLETELANLTFDWIPTADDSTQGLFRISPITRPSIITLIQSYLTDVVITYEN